MTRWCPCFKAAARCPHWWWRRGSSHLPAVRHPWPLGFMAHRDPARASTYGTYKSAEDSAFPPNLQLPSPGGSVDSNGADSGPCLGLSLCPHPQLPLGEKPPLVQGRWVTRTSPACVPDRLRFLGFPQPILGAHLLAVGSRDPALQHPGAGEDFQPAAGAPPHASRALWDLPGPRELLPAQVAGPGWWWGSCPGWTPKPAQTHHPGLPACVSRAPFSWERPKESSRWYQGPLGGG